ncbi:MAG TPA: phosphoribosylanthranilate isomerase [Acidiferrobacteraceae bacterium]|nr:phosphoribosylanthranilate isomerase [Acidiferrobacteraceae bacterium]
MRTRIKICGVTRPEDAVAAVDAGADAIGLVFFDKSPRHVRVDQAVDIVSGLPPFVTVVGLFVDATASLINEVMKQTRIDLLQFHGAEDPQQCISFGRPYIKAIAMRDGVDLHAEARRYDSAAALLLDSYTPGLAGGSGQEFAWQRIPGDLKKPVVLAGGLTPRNVTTAISQVQPYAVDVSSGVESRPGIKDRVRINAFIKAANTKEV